jgi:hypothetical protein
MANATAFAVCTLQLKEDKEVPAAKAAIRKTPDSIPCFIFE